jgi:hypothetical protein
MKKILSLSAILLLLATTVFQGCKKDVDNPSIETFGIEDYDLIQLTNDAPKVPVVLSYTDDMDIDSVTIRFMTAGTTTVKASNTIRSFIHSSTGRSTVMVPFPLPAVAPSGEYTVEYTITDKKGKTNSKKYNINILNFQTVPPPTCSFPTLPLPAGKNVWLQVTCPNNTNGEDVWVTGNFEGALGCGTGDWSGGGSTCLKMTRINNTCYYIALNLTNSSEFKITRGDWGKRMQTADGGDPDNLKWNGQGVMTYTIGNWSDRVVLPPVTLPASAIQTGKMTVVVDVNDTDPNRNYYLVKKGGNLADQSMKLTRIMNGANPTSRLAIAAPKDANTQYWIVRDDQTQVGINAYGYEQTAVWDGKSNPVNVNIDRYKNQGAILAPIQELYIVGGATPGGWNNPVPVPSQKFNRLAEGKYELTLQLTQGQGYLLLPTNGDWSKKWGMRGQKLSGNVTGNYKIEVDFFRGTYKLTKQ